MDTESRPKSLQGEKPRRFSKRNDLWCKWEAQMQLLRSALSNKSSDSHVLKLVRESMDLYRVSLSGSRSTETLLADLSGKNISPLEASFMWLGGWRPSSAITLVYSKTGVEVGSVDGQIESVTPSCCLSETQLASMELVLKHTRQAEGELSNELATLQMLLADQNMAKAIGVGNASASPENVVDGEFLIDKKVATLRGLFARSNRLRLQTLEELLNLLTPVQAAHCTIAAFELVFAMRNLGKVPTKNDNLCIRQVTPPVQPLDFSPREAQNSKTDGDGSKVCGKIFQL